MCSPRAYISEPQWCQSFKSHSTCVPRGLTNISEYALEKDYIVTDALQALFKLEDPQFDFIFCGGTCFSKAYGLLDRISQDVDIKVILKPGLNLS